MTHPTPLFDRAALMARRARARLPDLFLQQVALDEVQDRLSLVNRTFTRPAVITGFAGFWEDAIDGATVVADDDVLALEPGAHDLVIHAMCLHWASDPVGQIIQARRALAPDGLFLAVLLGGGTLNELRSVLAEAETQVTGGLSPRVSPMAEIRDLGALLQRAGLALPVADAVPLTARYRDMTHLMHDLRAMGEANALATRLRHPTRRAVFERAADLYAREYSDAEGRVRATFDVICLTGWSPSENQPRPLRPGSAQTRLADALGTRESSLPD